LGAGRRRRTDTTLQIRKTKKDEQLAKRRAGTAGSDGNVTGSVGGGLQRGECNKRLPTLAEVPTLIGTMQDQSCAPADRLEATREIRRMLSVTDNPPAKQLIESGVLPILIRFLGLNTEPTLQFEAAWALTNVASTNFTVEVVKAGATHGLVRLLDCRAPNVREQAAWCLGNIAGDCPDLRDLVLRSGALNPL